MVFRFLYSDTNNSIRGGSNVILVGFLLNHCIGRCTPGFFKYRGCGSWDSENPVRGVSGLVSHLAFRRAASCVRPVNVRVALKRHSNHINTQVSISHSFPASSSRLPPYPDPYIPN